MKEKGLMFKDKTKMVYAVFSVFVLVLLIATSFSGALTRTITDSSDNITGMIKAGNNYYEATGDNIQVAIDSLAGNGTVYLPSGTLEPTSTIYMNYTSMNLVGVSNGGSWGSDSGGTIIKSSASPILQIPNIARSKRGMVIKNINFIRPDDTRTIVGDAIEINRCATVLIENCGFSYINGSAINLSKQVYSTLINDCNFAVCGDNVNDKATIHIGGTDTSTWSITDIRIKNNVFEAGYFHDIYDNESYSDTSEIAGNYFEGAGNRWETAVINGEFYNGHIHDNFFYDSSTDSEVIAIKVHNDKIKIHHNTINKFQQGIQLWLNSNHCVVEGNSVTNIDTYALDVRGDLNIVSLNTVQGGDSGYAGIYVASDYNSITKNTVDDYQSIGIRINDGNYNLVDGNIVVEAGGTDTGTGIQETGIGNIIQKNYIEDTITTPINTGGTNTIILNNIGYNHNSLFPFYEQNTAPTINDNCTAYWYDLDDGFMYQIVNTYSTVYYVNMTTSI